MTKLQFKQAKQRLGYMRARLQSILAQLEKAHGASNHDGWVYCGCEMADMIKVLRRGLWELSDRVAAR